MILPILSYGHEVLRKPTEELSPAHPRLEEVIADMWETMYGARGCGLAAPQVNYPIRLFLVDSVQTYQTLDERGALFDGDTGIKQEFINARIISRSERSWVEDEGCLSIPDLPQPVERAWTITISYLDRDFQPHTETFRGTTARMIQHEYDHIEGILYLDHLKPFTRQRLKGKLRRIAKGEFNVRYPMKFCR
jgi:peptide deformylase